MLFLKALRPLSILAQLVEIPVSTSDACPLGFLQVPSLFHFSPVLKSLMLQVQNALFAPEGLQFTSRTAVPWRH